MIIRLNALQIAKFWDPIKYSLQQVERIGVDTANEQFNDLFASLLCDKSQCFIRYCDNKISAVMITEIVENRINKARSLHLRSLYVFSPFGTGEWQENFKVLKKIVVSEKCNRIVFESLNSRILGIAQEVGFTKVCTTMEFLIGE